MGLLRFAIKSSIVGGTVYYTIQEGLWSSPDEASKFYNKLYNNISPLFKENIPVKVKEEIDHMPNPLDIKVYAANSWNKGVIISIKFLSELPTHISNGINKIQQEIEKSNLSSGETSKSTK